jgi:L-aminopeptidase/D-esterase-like protein
VGHAGNGSICFGYTGPYGPASFDAQDRLALIVVNTLSDKSSIVATGSKDGLSWMIYPYTTQYDIYLFFGVYVKQF